MSSANFTGNAGESLFYRRVLGDAESIENQLYLQKKWGITGDNSIAPGGISLGLVLWLDASDTSTMFEDDCSVASNPADTNSDLVKCWMDKSGRGNNVEAVSEATLLTEQANSKSILSFSRNYYTGTLPDFSGNQAHTIFIVKKQAL